MHVPLVFPIRFTPCPPWYFHIEASPKPQIRITAHDRRRPKDHNSTAVDDGSGSDAIRADRMGKRGEKLLKELYDLTGRVSEAEMTSVLEGNCCIQGPVDESDHIQLQMTNTGHSLAGKKLTNMNGGHHMRVEPGTCNVCSAPCSSCMHFNRTLSAMGSKTECGFSGSTCGTKEADSFSFIDSDRMPTNKSRICDDSRHADSETSNFLSGSSGHDLYYENAESKATLKPLVACDATEDVDMPLIVPSVETMEDEFLQKKKNVTADGFPPSNIHTICNFCHRTFSSREDEQRGLECHGDNISCISGVRDSNLSEIAHNKNAAYRSAATSNLLAEGVKSEVQIEAADTGNENEESQSNCGRPRRCTDGSLDLAGSAQPALSEKSGFAEYYLLNNKPSMKVEYLGCISPSAYSSCQNGVIKELEAPMKIAETCLETANDTDTGFSSDDLIKTSIVSKQPELPSSLVVASSSMHAEQPHPIVVGGNSESEIEFDVKVCDICGAAGREDLLAICSRCTDGAEHTYCMQKKLRKLPEGDWLCEECRLKEKTKNKEDRQFKKETGNKEHTSETASRTSNDFKGEDTKNKKMDKSEAVSGTSKECKLKVNTENKLEGKSETKSLKQSLVNEISHRSLRKSSSVVSPNIEKKVIDPGFRGTPKGDQSSQPTFKRHANSQDVISITRKRTRYMSAENGSPRKKIALFRNSSLNDTVKARPANMLSSSRDQSLNGTRAFSRSQSLLVSNSSNGQGVLHSRYGPLSRSFSFNNINTKTKVKQLSANVPINPKAARESPSMHTRKEPLVSSLSKSRSFKSGSSGNSSVETASKTQFIQQSRGEDPRGMKRTKEKNVMEKKNTSITDHVFRNPVLRAGATVPVSKLDMKIAQHDSKLKSTSESNVLSVNKGSDVPSGIGGDEAQKRITYSYKSLGGASFSVKGNIEDQRACQDAKEGAWGTSSASNKVHANVKAERGTLQSAEFAYRDDKTKHITISSSSRKAVLNGNRMLRCQRCKETGHATQFCSIDKLKSSSTLKLSAEQNSRDGNTKGNKWKDVVEATITKNRIQKNNSLPDQREEIPVCSADLSFNVATNHQETLRKSEANPTETAHSTSQPVPPVEASGQPLFAELNATVAVSDEFKSLSGELPYQASILSNPFRTSAMPELDFIWQGSLDVLTSRGDPEHFDGIQAHLSSCASPRVRDLAIKLSSRVHLEGVSCVSTWPWQFQATGPKEENVALFFFAKDVESYERSYSKLLENMMKNDLALRGNLNGVDLLIYPSNKLPLNTRRWNRLFYLWGMFRGKETDFLLSVSSSQKKPSGSTMNAGPLVQELPSSHSSVVLLSEKAAVAENTENDSLRCHKSPKSKSLESATCTDASFALLSSKFEAKVSDVHDSPLHSSSDRFAADSVLSVGHVSYLPPASDSLGNMNRLPTVLVTHPESRFCMSRSSQSYQQVKTDETYVENIASGHGGKPDLDPSNLGHANNEDPDLTRRSPANSSLPRLGTESCRSEKKLEKYISMKSEAIFYDESSGNQMEMDHLSREKRTDRKRAQSCSTETVSQASVETSRRMDDTMTWMDKINYLPLRDEREQKRTCSGLKEETLFAKQSSKVHPLANFLNNEACGKTPDNSRSKERCFFPVEPSCARTSGLDYVTYILSSDDEDTPESSTPDLELALGDKKRVPKLEAIPLLFQSSERKAVQENPQVHAADAEDDISASLSLSLAAPDSKAPKLVLKSEQLTPDMPHVNTSLLLFGGFTGT